MREAQPRQAQGDIPRLTIGQRLEAEIISMKPSTYGQGADARDQIQFDVKLKPSGYNARAWISYYPIPNPRQYIGKLYLAIQRVMGQTYQTADQAMDALRNYGKIFVTVTGTNQVGDIVYPKFAVFADALPGETAYQQPTAQQPKAPPPIKKLDIPTDALNWLIANQAIIGQRIPDIRYNRIALTPIPSELHKLGILEMVNDYPTLTEKARDYL